LTSSQIIQSASCIVCELNSPWIDWLRFDSLENYLVTIFGCIFAWHVIDVDVEMIAVISRCLNDRLSSTHIMNTLHWKFLIALRLPYAWVLEWGLLTFNLNNTCISHMMKVCKHFGLYIYFRKVLPHLFSSLPYDLSLWGHKLYQCSEPLKHWLQFCSWYNNAKFLRMVLAALLIA